MRSTRVAEWILSQVTCRQRAEAVIGDLLEKVPSRGTLWFWWSVVTTAMALVWRDVATNPLRMLGLGFAAYVLQFVLLLVLILVASAAFGAIAGLMIITQKADPQRLGAWAPQFFSQGRSWAISLTGWCALASIQFLVGRWLARRSIDHELAPCVVFTVVSLTFSVVFSLSFSQPDALHAIGTVASSVLFVVLDFPLYAGAVSVRRKRVV